MLPLFISELLSGAIAKRLCPGLQIRLVQFDSGSRLQLGPSRPEKPCRQFGGGVFVLIGSMVTRPCKRLWRNR